MKHAGDDALNELEPLLLKLRDIEGLKEKKRGTFYFKSSAFLHFHEDPEGLFADIKISGKWKRFAVNSKRDQTTMVKAAKAAATRS